MVSEKTTGMKADHSGHRLRLRKKYREGGLSGMDDREVLELILTYAIPRRDVSGLARDMIFEIGSVKRVLEAEPSDLMERFDLSENTVTLIKLIGDIRRKTAGFLEYRRERIPSVLAACEYCHELLADHPYEAVVAMYLDGDSRIIDLAKVSEGSTDGAPLPIAAIVDNAVGLGAKRVLVAHNHPSNNALPSEDDIVATDMLSRALYLKGVDLVEHIIVSKDGCEALLHHVGVKTSDMDPSVPIWAREPLPEPRDELL